jgi:hypothetical protein
LLSPAGLLIRAIGEHPQRPFRFRRMPMRQPPLTTEHFVALMSALMTVSGPSEFSERSEVVEPYRSLAPMSV